MVGKIIMLDDKTEEARQLREDLREALRQEVEDQKWIASILGPVGSEKYLEPQAAEVPLPGPKIVPVIILVPRGI